MSFDMNPHDEDPHGECRHEIERLDDLLTDARNQVRLLQEELSAIRWQAQKDNLRGDLCDTYERWLLDIGKLSGCGHLDERLPQCIEEEFTKLSDENVIMRQSLKLARAIDSELESTADKLSTCWLFLDAVARSECLLSPRTAAAELLRAQQVPGWKT